ncbi:hypothetical protein [Fulvitalea axinellae]|uniref:hypothetical protein n=1 Tax=Fulvitalea axinellae TaxID=1182444 RepID=UPI0030CA3B13
MKVETLKAVSASANEVELAGRIKGAKNEVLVEGGFYIWEWGKKDRGCRVIKGKVDLETRRLKAKIGLLKPETVYAFVSYVEDKGFRMEGDIMNVKTLAESEIKVLELRTDGPVFISESTAMLSGFLKNYRNAGKATLTFSIWEKGKENEPKQIKVKNTFGVLTGDATGLRPDTDYSYTLLGINDRGPVLGDTLSFRTKKSSVPVLGGYDRGR